MLSLNQFFIIILLSTKTGALIVNIPFKYSANLLEFTLFQKTHTKKFYNNFKTVPHKLSFFYLDHASASEIKAEDFKKYLTKAVYKRPMEEVYAEVDNQAIFERDKAIQNRLDIKKGVEEKEEKEVVIPDNPPISNSIKLEFKQLTQIQIEKMHVEYLINSKEELAVLLFDEENYLTFTVVKSLHAGSTQIRLGYNYDFVEKGLSEEIFSALSHSLIITNPDQKIKHVHTQWIRPNANYAFALIAKKNYAFESKAKLFVENNRVNVYLYSENHIFRIRHNIEGSDFVLKLEKDKMVMTHFRVKMKTNYQQVKVFTTDNNSNEVVLYSTHSLSNGDFSYLHNVHPDVKKLFPTFKKPIFFLHKIENGFSIEVVENPLLNSVSLVKVIQRQGQSRISFFHITGSGSRAKQVILVNHIKNNPIELSIIDTKTKQTTKLSFIKKILLDENLFFNHHYIQFIVSQDFINQNDVSVLGSDPTETRLDYAYITNSDLLGTDIKSTSVFNDPTPVAIQVYLYKRSQGLIARMTSKKITLYGFHKSSKGWNQEETVSVPSLRAKIDLKLDVKVYDITNHHKEFPQAVFPIKPESLFFIQMSSTFQDQLTETKIMSCGNNYDTLNMCIFSGYNRLEIDMTTDGLTLWRNYQPQELTFRSSQFHNDLQVIYLKDDLSCEILTLNEFLPSKSFNFRKYFVSISEGRMHDDLTTTFCDHKINTCFLVLVDHFASTPTQENLQELKFDFATKKCEVPRKKIINGKMDKNGFNLKLDLPDKEIGFNFPEQLNFEDFKRIEFYGQETANTRCYSKISDKCLDLSFSLPDRKNIIVSNLFQSHNTIFDMPILLLKQIGDTLSVTSEHERGSLTFMLLRTGFFLTNELNSLGDHPFSSTRVYQNGNKHAEANLRIFLQGFEPVTQKVTFDTFMDFEQAIIDETEFIITAEFPANGHYIFTYFLQQKLEVSNFGIYYIENSDGQLEIIIYDQNVYEILEIIDIAVRKITVDIQSLPKIMTQYREKGVFCKLDFKVIQQDDNSIKIGGQETYFWKVDTCFSNTKVLVVAKGSTPPNAEEEFTQCYFRRNYGRQGLTGLSDWRSNYYEEDEPEIFRII